jgi:ABC-2 type transport system permease protein
VTPRRRHAIAAQTRVELAMTLRRGESLMVTIAIPVGILVFFGKVDALGSAIKGDPIDFLVPGVLALAVMANAMVSLGIATGFERQYGVLKRLGSTPLGRPRLLAAKTTAILGIELVQLIVLVPVALLLGWDPSSGAGAAIAAVFLATIAFAGLGLLMAGALRAEVTLAAANGFYLVLLLLGGMVIPLSKLPEGLRIAARVLPAAALSDVLHSSLGHAASRPEAWAVLAVWAVLAPVAAALTFRWE